MRKLPSFFFYQVVLPYGIFFDELVITILFPKSYKTPDIVYVPMNLSLRFCIAALYKI